MATASDDWDFNGHINIGTPFRGRLLDVRALTPNNIRLEVKTLISFIIGGNRIRQFGITVYDLSLELSEDDINYPVGKSFHKSWLN